MTSEHLVQLMVEERDRLQSAIDALQGTTRVGNGSGRRKPGRPATTVSASIVPTAHEIDPLPGIAPKKKAKWSAAKRKLQAERMKQFWAKKRAAKSKGGKVPF